MRSSSRACASSARAQLGRQENDSGLIATPHLQGSSCGPGGSREIELAEQPRSHNSPSRAESGTNAAKSELPERLREVVR